MTSIAVLAVVANACAPGPLGSTVPTDGDALRTSLDGVVESAAVPAAGSPGATTPPAPTAATEVVIAPPPERMEGRVDLQPPPRLLQTKVAPAAGGTWALVIGVNDYPGSAYDLRSAVNDADDVDRALGALGVPPERRLVLRDGQASRRNMLSSIDWLAAHAASDAVAVLFFAGHVRKLDHDTEAMVAADGASVTDAELARRLQGMAANRMWIGMAACYGGGFTEALAPGRVLTGAAAADERAYENSGFGRSYMVEYMIRQGILEGRAPDSVQSAFAYARDQLSRDFPDRLPVQLDRGSGPLDLRPPGVMPPPKPAKSTTTTTTAPVDKNSNDTTTSGSGGSGGQSSTTTTTRRCSSVHALLPC